MGNSRLISKEDKSKVESISLKEVFERVCPIYMSYGMTYNEFWYDDVYKCKYYREYHKLKVKQRDEEMWIQGMYIYEALCDVSPILHAFSQKGTKPLPYTDKPYTQNKPSLKTEEEKEKEAENARLIAQVHFQNWARAVKKQFENKK